MKRDKVFDDGTAVSDEQLQHEYGVNDSGGEYVSDGAGDNGRYQGKQPKVSITTSRPGAAENGGRDSNHNDSISFRNRA